jgi:hypothetical protein
MKVMRVMRQIPLTAQKICFVEIWSGKTNFSLCILAKNPHLASFASLNCDGLNNKSQKHEGYEDI